MRKSSVITLVLGIVLLILGILMVAGGSVMSAPHSAVYHYGHGMMMYSMRYSYALPGSGDALVSFGHLVFDSGLILMVIFALLQVADKRKDNKKTEEKEKKANNAYMKNAKAEAVDATVHEVDEEHDK